MATDIICEDFGLKKLDKMIYDFETVEAER